MRAMVYRGPHKVRVEEKDMPPVDPIVLGGPWLPAGAGVARGVASGGCAAESGMGVAGVVR